MESGSLDLEFVLNLLKFKNMNYLDVGKADDLEKRKERIIYRSLEILPGLLSWGTLIFVILGAVFLPILIAVFIILFDFYWFLRVIYFSFHQIASYFKMKKNLKINWLEKLKIYFPNFKEIYHIVIFPFFKESREVIEDSILHLKNYVRYPKDKIILVLAVEERGGEKQIEMAKELQRIYSQDFFKFFVFVHPKDLPGEVKGKGANVNFAILNLKKEIENLNLKKENILLSIFDVDTKPEKDYFSIVTFWYLKLKKKPNFAFQPVPVYNNNLWQAPFFSRIVSTSNTFWQMIQQSRPEQLVTYSSHSLPWQVFEKVSFPKEVVSDDSRIFWKCFFAFESNFQVVPLFYPVYMDAVLGKNLFSTISNQYKQQRRWAWGAENVPFVIFNFLKNKKISFFTKIFHSFIILEGFWSWAVASLLIFLLGWLTPTLGGKSFNKTFLGFNLPTFTQNLMLVASFGIFLCAFLSLLLLPPSPKKFLKKISIFFQWLFIPVTLIVFGCFPALDAQTRLMFKRYMGFWVTEKCRK
jgi:hypothetical protein